MDNSPQQPGLGQQSALAELHTSGVRYALLRNPTIWEDKGDIDIIIQDQDDIEQKLINTGYIKYSTSPTNRKYIRFIAQSRDWIHLDVISAVEFGHIKPPVGFIDELLKAAALGPDGIIRLAPADEALLILFHSALAKGQFNPKYRTAFLQTDRASILRRAPLYSFLPKPLDFYTNIIESLRDGKTAENDTLIQIQTSFGFCRPTPPSLLNRVWRRARHFISGSNMMVLLGPDGAGKSTIASSLASLRWPPTRLQFMGPGRTTEMRASFKLLLDLFGRLRVRFPKRNPIGFLCRLCWQIVCYFDLLERVLRHSYFRGSGGLVIFDRFACDMFFRKPTIWNELLFIKLFPTPRNVFLCVGNAEDISRRKPELAAKDILRTLDLYRKTLLGYGIPYIEVNTTESSLEGAVTQVATALMNKNQNPAPTALLARHGDKTDNIR